MNLKSMYPEEEIFFRSRPKRSKSTHHHHHHHRNGPRLRLHSLTLSLTLRLLFTSIRLLWLEKEGREPSKQKPRNHTLVDHVRYQPASQQAAISGKPHRKSSLMFFFSSSSRWWRQRAILIACLSLKGILEPQSVQLYRRESSLFKSSWRVCEWEVITGPKLTLTISISSWVCFDLQFFLWPQ